MGFALSVVNLADGATITSAQTFETAFPLTNVTVRQLSTQAIVSGGVTDEMVIDVEQNTTQGLGINPVVCLGGLGVHADADHLRIEIFGSAVAMGDDDLFSSDEEFSRETDSSDPTQNEFPFNYFKAFTSAAPKYVRIRITTSTPIEMKLGRVWIGPSVLSSYDHNISSVKGIRFGGVSTTGKGGQAFGAAAKSRRFGMARAVRLTDTQLQTMMRSLAYAGLGREFVFIRATGLGVDFMRDNAFYCHMEGDARIEKGSTVELNAVEFDFIEEL